MRRTLWWALGASSLASVAAMWSDGKPAAVIAAVERQSSQHLRSGESGVNTAAVSASTRPLPGSLSPVEVEAARRDVFALVEAPPPAVVAVAQPAPAPAPPPPPPPPPSQWRYLGSMTTPAGERLVMLSNGNASMAVQPGTRLPDGYVVEALRDDAVVLTHPSHGTTAELALRAQAPTTR